MPTNGPREIMRIKSEPKQWRDKSKDAMRGKRGTGTEDGGRNLRSDLSTRTVKDDEALGRGIKSQKTGPSLKTSPEMSVQRDLGEEKPKTTGTLGRRRTLTVSSGGGETPEPMPVKKRGRATCQHPEGKDSKVKTDPWSRRMETPTNRRVSQFTGGILTPRVYPMLRLIQPNAEPSGTAQELPRI